MRKLNKTILHSYASVANLGKSSVSTFGFNKKAIKRLNLNKNEFLAWQYFIIYYLILRFIFGLTYPLIYASIILMLLARISFEKIAMIFFLIALIVYLFGQDVEANHYFSFVYIFMALSLCKYLYLLLKERFQNEK